MSSGYVTIKIPAGVLNTQQEEQLREDLSFHDHADMTEDQLHIIRSKVEAHVRASGALEMPGPIDIKYSEPDPATETLLLLVERQIMLEDGTWTPWMAVNLNNPAMELKSGQRVRQRVRMVWNSGRLEGKVLEFQV